MLSFNQDSPASLRRARLVGRRAVCSLSRIDLAPVSRPGSLRRSRPRWPKSTATLAPCRPRAQRWGGGRSCSSILLISIFALGLEAWEEWNPPEQERGSVARSPSRPGTSPRREFLASCPVGCRLPGPSVASPCRPVPLAIQYDSWSPDSSSCKLYGDGVTERVARVLERLLPRSSVGRDQVLGATGNLGPPASAPASTCV